MAAFDAIKSGIPMMDEALQNIRLGDNVVWQVPSLDEFRVLAEKFANQAIEDGRNLIYVRFAEHEPILTPREGLKIEQVELNHRFEKFTVDIHNLIEREGKDAFYVFDCLSELEAAWATDLLMGNFFHLTCPFLFILDTACARQCQNAEGLISLFFSGLSQVKQRTPGWKGSSRGFN